MTYAQLDLILVEHGFTSIKRDSTRLGWTWSHLNLARFGHGPTSLNHAHSHWLYI